MDCEICGIKVCDCCGECHNEQNHPKPPPPPPLTADELAERAAKERESDRLWVGMRSLTDWKCPICDGDVMKRSRGFGKGSDLECNDCGRRLVLTPDLHQKLPLGEEQQ